MNAPLFPQIYLELQITTKCESFCQMEVVGTD